MLQRTTRTSQCQQLRKAKEGIQTVTAEKWKKCVDHVIREVESHYRTCDGIVEQAEERLSK